MLSGGYRSEKSGQTCKNLTTSEEGDENLLWFVDIVSDSLGEFLFALVVQKAKDFHYKIQQL